MGTTGKIHCRVVDGDDRPLSGRVVVGERRGGEGDRIGYWTTGDDGEFVLNRTAASTSTRARSPSGTPPAGGARSRSGGGDGPTETRAPSASR